MQQGRRGKASVTAYLPVAVRNREEGRVPRAALLRENRANGQQGRAGKVFFSRKEIVGKLGTVCVRSHKCSVETPPDVPRQLGVRSHTPSEKDKKGQLWEQLWEPQPPPLHRQVRNSARACGGGGKKRMRRGSGGGGNKAVRTAVRRAARLRS